MKYMTFNSSCSFAGVANMLAAYGIDAGDRAIALGMKLPWMFAKETEGYLAGAMLQTAAWFDLFLRPLGLAMHEEVLEKSAVAAYLRQQKTAMLGLRVDARSKHAVVYVGSADQTLHFLNNKWAEDPAPAQLALTEAELYERLDAPCVVATLEPAAPLFADFRPLLRQSLEILEQMHRDIVDFCAVPHSAEEVFAQMNPLFRPLLVDGIAMAELMDEPELQAQLTAVQHAFLAALRSGPETLTLCDCLPMDTLQSAVTIYADQIRRRLA